MSTTPSPLSEQLPGGLQAPGNPQSILQQFAQMMARVAAAKKAQETQSVQGGVASPARVGGPPPIGGASGSASMIPAPTRGVITNPGQMPLASQDRYQTGTQRKQAVGSDLVAGVVKAVQNTKSKNEQKQFLEAQNTWNQLLAANASLQQNPNDPQAHAIIDAILSDKKRMKMVEESLHIMLPKEPGAEPDTPASKGAKSAIGDFMKKVGGTLDPRTEAMKMKPQQPGAAPNTPGGYMWSFPQQSPIQASLSQAQNQLAQDPQAMADAARASVGLPTSKDIAQAEAKVAEAKAHTELYQNQLKTQGVLADASMKRAQADLIKANAYANYMKKKAAGGAVGAAAHNPKLVQAWSDRVADGEIKNITQIPKELRNAVVESLAGVPIQQKFNAQQQQAWDALPAATNMLNKLDNSLSRYFAAHPEAETDTGLAGVGHTIRSHATFAGYRFGMDPSDPIASDLIKDAAFLMVNGVSQFARVGRSLKVYEDIKQHLPQATDTPALLKDKAQWLRNEIIEQQKQSLSEYRYSGKLGGARQYMEERGGTIPPQAKEQTEQPPATSLPTDDEILKMATPQ